MKSVTCVGGLAVDLLARPVIAVPNLGGLELVDEMALALGGCAQNCACALVRLGIPAHLIGRIGEDGLGDYVVRTLTSRGVDTVGLRRVPFASTSSTMVFVAPDGERRFLHSIGATGTLRHDDIDWIQTARSQILFVGQFGLLGEFDHAVPEVLRQARKLGVETALDTVWDPTGELAAKIGPCLAHLDYFLPSYDEARLITGLDDPRLMGHEFHRRGVRTVGIKLGIKGCYLSDATGRESWIPAFEVTGRDTTGAGDAWCAGFLAGLLRGLDLPASGRLGNAVGACCVLDLGTYDGVRTMDETLAFMATTPLAADISKEASQTWA